jgi:CRISPR/Cas system CSM-associated protein Csm2 small subunit
MKENLKKEKPEEDVGDESDQSDYSLGDFPDLTGSFVEESHIKEFYEKEMEKIESDPHRIERVKAIKEAVVAYYNIKGQKGEALVAELDCMTYDR